MKELLNVEFDYNTDGDDILQQLLIRTPWSGEDYLDYYVLLNNTKECTDRLKDLIDQSNNETMFCELTRDDLKEFLGECDPDKMSYITFQEYEGSKNEEAIQTFFKHAYCFKNDCDDKCMIQKERFLIWLYGYGLELSTVKKCIYHLEDVKAIFTMGGVSKLSIPEDQIRISVWRIQDVG